MAVDRGAASSAEYALILAIVGAGLGLAAFGLGRSIECAIDRTSTTLADGAPPGSPNYGKSDPQGLAKGHGARC